MGWRDETTWKNQAGIFPVARAGSRSAEELPCLRTGVFRTRSLRGDGVAFTHLLHGVSAHRYGIEIDANRAEQARALGIETLQANAMDVRCPAEAVSLLYLNPPYDWESGESNNQRLELVFLEHTYRWLKAGGVLRIRHSAAAIGEMREIAERTFHRFARVPAHRAGLPRIQADRSARSTPQTAFQGF